MKFSLLGSFKYFLHEEAVVMEFSYRGSFTHIDNTSKWPEKTLSISLYTAAFQENLLEDWEGRKTFKSERFWLQIFNLILSECDFTLY